MKESGIKPSLIKQAQAEKGKGKGKTMMKWMIASLAAAVMVSMTALAGECCPKAQEKAGCKKAQATVTCDKANTAACPLAAADKKVLKIQDGNALTCACAADCKCEIKADDATKCSCGKDVVKVALPAKAAGTCPMKAAAAGKCNADTAKPEAK